jgi:hypothetical protein
MREDCILNLGVKFGSSRGQIKVLIKLEHYPFQIRMVGDALIKTIPKGSNCGCLGMLFDC